MESSDAPEVQSLVSTDKKSSVQLRDPWSDVLPVLVSRQLFRSLVVLFSFVFFVFNFRHLSGLDLTRILRRTAAFPSNRVGHAHVSSNGGAGSERSIWIPDDSELAARLRADWVAWISRRTRNIAWAGFKPLCEWDKSDPFKLLRAVLPSLQTESVEKVSEGLDEVRRKGAVRRVEAIEAEKSAEDSGGAPERTFSSDIAKSSGKSRLLAGAAALLHGSGKLHGGGGMSSIGFPVSPRRAPHVTALIPKVVHKVLIFEGGRNANITLADLPARLRAAVSSWEGVRNPGYTVRFWNLLDVRRFFHDHYTEKLVDSLDALLVPTYQVNLARWAILAKLGGWYADMQTVLLQPIDETAEIKVLRENRPIFFCERIENRLTTTVFRAPPGHPWLVRAVNLVHDRVQRRSYGEGPFFTGTHALGTASRIAGCCSFRADSLREEDLGPVGEDDGQLPKIGYFVHHDEGFDFHRAIDGFAFSPAKGAFPFAINKYTKWIPWAKKPFSDGSYSVPYYAKQVYRDRNPTGPVGVAGNE